ncbi:MAG: NAD(P)-dependent glycerol-1-phosphate dehydrogenase, partial [Thermoplasmatota archaeon]
MSVIDKTKLMVFPRNVLVGHDAIDKLGAIVRDLDTEANGIIVVDAFSKRTLAPRLQKVMEAEGFNVEFYESPGPTMKSVHAAVKQGKAHGASYYLGVGGGSVIDVAKLAAYQHGPGFVSVPTTASHDGICSGRASIKELQGSTSKEAKPPVAIVADTGIISQAPFRMLSAGCADVISNLTACLDWELAHRLKDEEFSTFAAVLAKSGAELILDNADIIKPGLEESSWLAIKSLIVSGVSMAVAGSSRPASGAEHMFSHTLDRIAPGKAMHGEQVGIGTIITMNLHGGDWKRVRAGLQAIGAPTTAKELGIPKGKIIEALTTCHELRPDRYTILGESGLTKNAAQKVCKETG